MIRRRIRLRGRSARIKTRKADPKKRRFAKRRCQPYLDWLKEQPCGITKCLTGEWWFHGIANGPWSPVVVDPAHVTTRGAGGADLWNALPLAHHLHEEQHRIGIKSFEGKYGVDLRAIAKEHTERFLEQFPEFGEPPS